MPADDQEPFRASTHICICAYIYICIYICGMVHIVFSPRACSQFETLNTIRILELFPKILASKIAPRALKHEYRGPYSKSQSNTTDDVIVFEMIPFYTICCLVFISEAKFKLSCATHGFWKFPLMVFIFDLMVFQTKTETKTWVIRKMSHEPQIVTIFVSML